MRILEEKQLERKIFRNLRDKSLLSDRKKVENNVKKFVNSIYNEDKEDIYIAIYWPLKNEVDIRSLKKFCPGIAKMRRK